MTAIEIPVWVISMLQSACGIFLAALFGYFLWERPRQKKLDAEKREEKIAKDAYEKGRMRSDVDFCVEVCKGIVSNKHDIMVRPRDCDNIVAIKDYLENK